MKKRLTPLLAGLLLTPSLFISNIRAEMTNEVDMPIIPYDPDKEDDMIIHPYYPDFDHNTVGYNQTEASGEEIFNAMLGQNYVKPLNFDEDTRSPYATDEDEEFSMLEKLEVFEYISWKGAVTNVKSYDDLKTNTIYVNGTAQNLSTSKNAIGSLRFAQGVAFDPTGCGQKTHVAIVGYRESASNSNWGDIYLYIINAVEDKVEKEIALVLNSERVKTAMDALTVVDSKNFFQITAGDYNGDGKDTIVVYDTYVNPSSAIESRFGLKAYDYDADKMDYVLDYIYETGNDGKYLNHDYVASTLPESTSLQNQLCVSLDSGDVNGDGIDDLIVLSYTGDITSDKVKEVGNKTVIPTLVVGYGEKGKRLQFLQIDKTSIVQVLNNESITMVFPDVSVGDIDGDGDAEILVAGYRNKTSATDIIDVNDDQGQNVMAYAYYETTGAGTLNCNGGLKIMARADTSPIAKDDSLREHEDFFQQYSVECVAVNGKNTQEYVFANGWFYFMENGELKSCATNNTDSYKISDLESVTNPFKELVDKVGNKDVDEVFIMNASAGNFFATASGNEAIILTVGYKTHTDENKEGDYNFDYYVFWNNTPMPTDSFDIGDNYGTSLKLNYEYFSNYGTNYPLYELTGSADNYFVSGKDGFSVLLTPVDIGDDTVVARYSGKAFAYTDPTVVAFLQAAPYFEELGEGNSSTTYSYSESYRTTSAVGSENSFDVGVAESMQAGPLQQSMEMGIAYELNKEFAKSQERTFTTTFEASDQNQVILRQTLMYYYFYDVKTSDGEIHEAALVVSAPQYPVLTSVSVDQYNALATAYNRKVDENRSLTKQNFDKDHKMQLITDDLKDRYYLNNEGNPFGYASDSTAYGTSAANGGWDLGQAEAESADNWMRLSYAGGTQTQTFSKSVEEEKTTSVAEGCFANLTIMLGADAGVIPVSAYAGVTAGYEYLSSHSYSAAHVTSEETSGTVQNLTNDLTDYGFDWKLIGWKTGDLFAGVPFVGYAVRTQRDLPKPVKDLQGTYNYTDGGTVTLTWTSPEIETGRTGISHFVIYDDVNGATHISQITNKGEGQEHSVTINVREYPTNNASFTVCSFLETGTAETSGIMGIPSDEVFVVFSLTSQEIETLISDAKTGLQTQIDTLNTQLAEQGTANAENIRNLIAAYKQADELLQAQIDEGAAATDELKAQMETALQLIETSMDTMNAELSAAIENLKQATDENMDQAVADLTEAYTGADALMNVDIESLQEKHAALETLMNEAFELTGITISQVQDDLEAVRNDLTDNMTSDFNTINNRIDTISSTLNAASQMADSALQENIDAQAVDIQTLTTAYKQDIDSLQVELNLLRIELNALQDSIKAQEKTDASHQSEIDDTKTITYVSLGVGSVSLVGNIALLIAVARKLAWFK
ncbi:MAG: hypothetical protein ACI32N_08905 [Bulleidia sp.]